MPDKIYHSINTFNAGEVSDLIFNREDITKYKSACRVLENAFPLVEGGAKKMPGTYFAGSTRNNSHARLATFQFSTAQGAILEFTAGIIRIWEPTLPGTWTLGLVESAGSPIELVTPYTDADLFLLDCGTQSADVLWIFHPSYPPACVERLGPSNWAYALQPPGEPPVRAGEPAYRGTPGAITNTGLSGLGVSILQITQAFPLVLVTDRSFDYADRVYINNCAGMAELNQGEFFVTPVVAANDAAQFTGHIDGGSSTAAGLILTVTAVSSGTLLPGMLISGPNVSPGTVIVFDISGTGNTGTYQVNVPQLVVAATAMSGLGGFAYNLISIPGALFTGSISSTVLTVTAIAAGALYVGMAIYVPGEPTSSYNGTVVSSFGTGTGGIGTYNLNMSLSFGSQRMSTVPVVSTAYLAYQGGGFATKVIPFFDAAGKYPACGTFYQGRLCVGGSNDAPTQFNGSVSEDFPDFITDPNADDHAIQFTLLSTLLDQIISMLGTSNSLMLGTAGGVWTVTGGPSGVLSQSGVQASKQTSIGVSQLAPQLVGDSAVFVSRSAKIVNFLTFNFVSNEWDSYDLTRLNRQITIGPTHCTSGILQTAFQAEPYPIFWAVRADGQLLGLVFNKQDQIYAWFRINMLPEGGSIESVATISSLNQEDMVVVVVSRTANGVPVRYVEYFYPQELFNQLSNAFFVHCGLQINLGPSVAITGITNANPPTVTAPGHSFANGSFVQIANVAGMVEINQGKDEAYTVINTNLLAGTLQLQGMDTTGFGVYTAGGTALPVTNEVTGMSYLIGNRVTAVGDCAIILQPTIVESDTVTFDFYCSQITIGLPYKLTVQPSNPVLSSPSSTTHGMKQKLTRVTISMYQSLGGKYGVDPDHMYDIVYGPGSKGGQP